MKQFTLKTLIVAIIAIAAFFTVHTIQVSLTKARYAAMSNEVVSDLAYVSHTSMVTFDATTAYYANREIKRRRNKEK